MAKPITPKEVFVGKVKRIPEYVIKAVNELLVEKADQKVIKIGQDEIVSRIISTNPQLDRNGIFERKEMDFESNYKEVGWDVLYNKPHYNDTERPYFIFKINNKWTSK